MHMCMHRVGHRLERAANMIIIFIIIINNKEEEDEEEHGKTAIL